jgi:hypothetical protein
MTQTPVGVLPARIKMQATADPFGGRQVAQVNVYALNPLVDWLQLTGRIAGNVPQPPTMFDNGDLPAATASGVDPDFLRQVPWQLRHSAANTRDLDQVRYMATDDAADDMFLQNQAGAGELADYQDRVRAWLYSLGA